MTVGLYHPTQRTHIQLSISSEVTVVDIDVSRFIVLVSEFQKFRTVVRTEFIDMTINISTVITAIK